jgi:hypothetical protein
MIFLNILHHSLIVKMTNDVGKPEEKERKRKKILQGAASPFDHIKR